MNIKTVNIEQLSKNSGFLKTTDIYNIIQDLENKLSSIYLNKKDINSRKELLNTILDKIKNKRNQIKLSTDRFEKIRLNDNIIDAGFILNRLSSLDCALSGSSYIVSSDNTDFMYYQIDNALCDIINRFGGIAV